MIESLVQPHDHHACDCLACAIPLRKALPDTDNQRLTPLSWPCAAIKALGPCVKTSAVPIAAWLMRNRLE